MLNLNDLSLFVRVVDHGGFAPASRALSIPKSTLSKRIGELERAMNVRLIQRTSRHFAVTELGAEVHRHATAMLIEAEAVENTIMGRLAEPSGTVRITASVPVVQMTLAPIMPELAHTYPRLRLALHTSDRMIDIVKEGFDIAIRSHFSPLPDSDLVQHRLSADPVWLVASPGYLERCGTPLFPDDLAAHDGLISEIDGGGWSLTGHEGIATSVRPIPRYYANESTALLAAAQSGLGIVALPATFCQEHIDGGHLARVLPEWTAGTVTTTLLVPHKRGQLPSVRTVIDFIATHVNARR
ncbi:LysR substrate-binding domain-containing protein [Pelagibacterium limicola]|uniref:LysR substrate-binding domain-containing protein n=1 Tax=Pelagibacterium limicola TaxID=2791022 RepID=UPI0018AFA1F1|nr:LysR substrate-binding domain-containing protein [Pelagibacterium limicola]